MSPLSSPPDEEPSGPSLREIAHHLTTPARGGMVLTKARIADLGARLGLPAGFGEKSQMLMSLFRAAADLELVPALVDALRAEAESWNRRYRTWADEYPASAEIWRDWVERLERTLALLAEMAAAAAVAAPSEPPARGPFPAPVDGEGEYAD